MSGLTKSNQSRRIIIYGAGAIGGVVGGHLARTGNDVILIGRPGHVNAIREHGLRLITPTGTHILQLPAVTAPDQIDFKPNDVVFLCVKSQNTVEALRALHAVTKNVPIFCFQNGVGNEEAAARYFPRIYGASVLVGAVFLTNGEVIVRYDPPGQLVMGRYPTGTDDLVEVVAANLRAAGFLVLVTSDIMSHKWGKLVLNLGNAISAIINEKVDESNHIIKAARQEAREILAQAGIKWISQEELTKQWPERAAQVQQRKSLDVEAQGSAWQSLTRKQGTIETDFFNGEIVRLAKRLGRQAPVNEALVRISQEMAAKRELPGKYTSDELCRLLGLD